jgi:uncharacterized protein (TIRG00374 family)
LIWTIRQTPLTETVLTLRQLTWFQVLILVTINSLIMAGFGLRWFLFLRELGVNIPYMDIIRYRLAAFGISYLTPGPHLGGEPLQIYYLQKDHAVPLRENLAALSMDKLIEVFTNFSVLLFGLIFSISSGLMDTLFPPFAMAVSLFVLALPGLYFFLLWRQKRALSWLIQKIRFSRFRAIKRNILATEKMMAGVFRRSPLTLILSGTVSVIIWLALIGEYYLALRFLGLPATFTELMVIITAARLALLTPMPSAIGALEFSQVFALELLGYPAALGLSISLLIRSRDLLFSFAGLLWGRVFAIQL